MKKQYWLGNYKNVNQHGWSMDVELLDGPHSAPKGVREAEHLIKGMGLDKGKERNYVMVTIESVPEGKVNLNEKAIEQNRKIVNSAAQPKPPKYVSILGDCALVLDGERYFRNAGVWSVGYKFKDGKWFSTSRMSHLNGIELVEVTEEQWRESNAGYV